MLDQDRDNIRINRITIALQQKWREWPRLPLGKLLMNILRHSDALPEDLPGITDEEFEKMIREGPRAVRWFGRL